MGFLGIFVLSLGRGLLNPLLGRAKLCEVKPRCHSSSIRRNSEEFRRLILPKDYY